VFGSAWNNWTLTLRTSGHWRRIGADSPLPGITPDSVLRLRSVGIMAKVVARDAEMKEIDQMRKDIDR